MFNIRVEAECRECKEPEILSPQAVRAAFTQQLISRITQRVPYPDGPRKVMKVRDRNVDFTLGKNGTLKPVMSNRFYKHHYTHIQLRGKIHSVVVSHGIFDTKIVWIN